MEMDSFVIKMFVCFQMEVDTKAGSDSASGNGSNGTNTPVDVTAESNNISSSTTKDMKPIISSVPPPLLK